MMQKSIYLKYVETIRKEDFQTIFLSCEPRNLFSKRELGVFTFPKNARSLAGRYLIKKTICDYLKEPGMMNEIEILNDDFGKPEVLPGANMLNIIDLAGIKKIHCSISHSKNLIAGMTVICF
jgi:phosphopantetheinyl transferase (holo-ACP synthase)